MTGTQGTPDPRRGLVLDEARRGIDQQVKDLDALRSRSSGLAALAVGASTFLAGVILNQDLSPSCPTWIGFVILAASLLLALNTLRPYTFTFNLDVSTFDARSHGDDIDELVRAAALGLRDAATANQETLDRLFKSYVGALGLLVVGAALVAISLGWS